jgi:pimeloyl-ACP methyl ester carboxylesterase
LSATSRRIALATALGYHVLEWDAPGDTTFVLVHGFLDFAYAWHEVAPLLGAHAIAVDLRGHGDSDWIGPGGYYHFMDYVADLDDVIRQLARERVIVVGHSMGGGVAAYWAGTRPSRPAALALLEGLGPPDQSGSELTARTAQWIDAWRGARGKSKPMASLADAAARLRKHDPLLGEALALRLAEAGTRAPRVTDLLAAGVSPVASTGGLTWKHDPLHLTMGPYPFRRDQAAAYWRRIACPVLAIDGGQSLLNLPEAERAARRAEIPHCRHAVLDGAGHMMLRHQPAAIAALLRALA